VAWASCSINPSVIPSFTTISRRPSTLRGVLWETRQTPPYLQQYFRCQQMVWTRTASRRLGSHVVSRQHLPTRLGSETRKYSHTSDHRRFVDPPTTAILPPSVAGARPSTRGWSVLLYKRYVGQMRPMTAHWSLDDAFPMERMTKFPPIG